MYIIQSDPEDNIIWVGDKYSDRASMTKLEAVFEDNWGYIKKS